MHGQPDEAGKGELSLPTAAPSENIGEQPPSPDQAMLVYRDVNGQVRSWNTTAIPAENSASSTLPPAAAACVTLRLSGEMVGHGVNQAFWGSFGPADGQDPRRMVALRAANVAIRAADARLPLPNDLMRAARVQELASGIQISLELAGRLRPVLADSWETLDASLNPGLDGLVVCTGKPGEEAAAMRSGAAKVVFPSEMMAHNTLPQTVLRGMIAACLGEGGAAKAVLDPKTLRDEHGVRAWTFRVTHLAQCKPREEARFLYRGARTVGMGEMTVGELREMAQSLANNLEERAIATTDESRMLGTLQPWSGEVIPDEQSFERLLMAMAAVRTDKLTPNPLIRDNRMKRFSPHLTWRGVLPARGPVSGREWCLSQPLMSYFNGKASTKFSRNSSAVFNEAMAIAAGARQSSVEPPPFDGFQRAVSDLDFSRLTAPERALVLYAYSIHDCRPDESAMRHLEKLVRQQLGEHTPGQSAGLMPWMGWAELNLQELKCDPGDVDAPPDIPSAIALREMRAQCWKHQLGMADVTEDSADLLGGIVFTRGSGTPLPTWQCVRPIAFIATMLGDDRLTEPAERQQETFRLLMALRFLRQLQADDTCGWMYPEPARAIGGIRASTWDHTMPPDATSLTLMAVCEAIKSLERLEAEEASGKP